MQYVAEAAIYTTYKTTMDMVKYHNDNCTLTATDSPLSLSVAAYTVPKLPEPISSVSVYRSPKSVGKPRSLSKLRLGTRWAASAKGVAAGLCCPGMACGTGHREHQSQHGRQLHN